MKTVYALTFFNCPVITPDLAAELQGPFLFEQETTAVERLYDYVEPLLWDWKESLYEYAQKAQDSDDPSEDEINELIPTIREKGPSHMVDAIDSFFNFLKDDEQIYSGYAIQELPTMSFLEDLNSADAVEIDGNFIRHFHRLSPEDWDNNEDLLVLEAVMWDDGDSYHYAISQQEALGAKYNTNSDSWSVAGVSVQFVRMHRN